MSSITYGGNFLEKMISVIVLQIVLIILNVLFSSAEISVISLNEAKVKQMAEEGDKRAEKAAMLLKKPARFLETIESAVTFASLLSGAFVAVYVGGFLKKGSIHLLEKWNISVSGQVLSAICFTFASFMEITEISAFEKIAFNIINTICNTNIPIIFLKKFLHM